MKHVCVCTKISNKKYSTMLYIIYGEYVLFALYYPRGLHHVPERVLTPGVKPIFCEYAVVPLGGDGVITGSIYLQGGTREYAF